jgi:hypothetical protein
MLRLICLVTLSSAPPIALLAQNPLNIEYLSDDLNGVGRLGKLVPLERLSLADIPTVIGADRPERDDDTGFGGRLIEVAKGHGYVTVRFRGFAFNGRLAWARVSAEAYPSRWATIRDGVMKAWEGGGGPPYSCTENECFHEWRQREVLGAYKESVALQLGRQSNVEIPVALKEHYEYLTSPFELTLIGVGACGLPSPDEPSKPLPGREGVDALVAARRIDLIVNVLRGYNAGGRVYAALALERLNRDGVPLPAGVAATIKKVRDLKVPVSTCFGCIVNSGLHASDILKRWREFER